jgi:hypothetical protein
MSVVLLTDQPGRVLAVFCFAPTIIYKSFLYNDTFLLVFGTLLYMWDAYWLTYKLPRQNTRTHYCMTANRAQHEHNMNMMKCRHALFCTLFMSYFLVLVTSKGLAFVHIQNKML